MRRPTLFLAGVAIGILAGKLYYDPPYPRDKPIVYVSLYHNGKKIRQWLTLDYYAKSGLVDFRELGEDYRTTVTGNVVVEKCMDAFQHDLDLISR